MKKIILTVFSIILALGLAGCATTTYGQEVKSNLDRNKNPQVSSNEVLDLVTGNNGFAVDLYKQLSSEPGNLFFSPYSISQALAMAYAGARGETAMQMAEAMQFGLGNDRLHSTFNSLGLELDNRGKASKEGFRLSIVNAIWGQKDFPFQSAYLDTLAVNYGAGLRTLDFIQSPEESRTTINNWVSDETEKRIEDLLPAGSITVLTRLVLTNAIYFKAGWKSKFREDNTVNDNFTLLTNTTVSVPMMSQTAEFGFYKGDHYQAVELPYEGDEISMVILLPDAGTFTAFEDALDRDLIYLAFSRLANGRLQLTMPKFKTESEFGLNDTLGEMGMPLAFSPEDADFSGIDGKRDLYISDVVHKAYVAVDENGTEAAAATGVVIGTTSMPPSVTVDRPFIYMIRDIQTNTILFLGRVVNPAQ